MKIRLGFIGTPQLAAQFLEKLQTDKEIDVEIGFVLTQPDAEIGRKKILTPSEVKQIAEKYNIPVFTEIDSLLLENELLKNIDCSIMYYYGKIIPQELISAFPYGIWNIHFSALPQYRGAHPAGYAIFMNDITTAVSIVQTDLKLDHGPLIAQKIVDIDEQETRDQLEARLGQIGYELVKTIVQRLPLKARATWGTTLNVPRIKQNDQKATYTIMPKKEHGFIPLPVLIKGLKNEPLTEDELPILIKEYLKKNSLSLGQLDQFDLRNSPKIIFDYFRGLYPWPGLWSLIPINKKETRLLIKKVSIKNQQLTIEKVKLEGKKEMSIIDFQYKNIFS